MNLVIDIGNSFQKIGLFDPNGDLVFVDSFSKLEYSYISKLILNKHISKSIISEVGNLDPDITQILEEKTQLIPFTHELKLPIQLAYLTPDTLGKDRIANSVAAHSLFPNQNCLSIQAGSCIVYDFIDQNGTFLGGAISPGVQMRFKALHEQTARLPLLQKSSIDYFLGKDTQQSIKSGVINGVIFEIEGQINSYISEFKDVTVLLTGGDMDYLKKSIKNQIFATPNLVMFGLNKILNLNV
jgi:type III pantothenate kinase